jgi:hypothetical protein
LHDRAGGRERRVTELPNIPGAAPVPLLVDRRETARLLGVCPNTVSNLQQRGELVPVRIGVRVLFDRRDLIAFIDARKAVKP